MKTIGTAAFALTILASGVASAAPTENLLTCVDRGFAIQQCVLQNTVLADALVEGTRSYEATYIVSYELPCIGHKLALGVAAGDSYAEFEQGSVSRTLNFSGTGPLRTSDPDPTRTRKLTFSPGCLLRINDVEVVPSSRTILLWSDEAKSLARIIDLSVQRYLLAKDYLDIAQWNRDKLLLLKDKLDALVVAYPTNLHYKTMLSHVNATLQNQPSSVTLAELTEAGEDVRVTLRRELDADVATGRALVDRFQRWQQQAESTLQDVLNHIPTD